MAEDRKPPNWLPDWFPHTLSLEYSIKLIQLGILLLAAAYLSYHLLRGRLSKVTATAAGAS